MFQGEKQGVSLQNSIDKYHEQNKMEDNCHLELADYDDEPNDYAKISLSNMFLPIMFWCICVIIAIVLQIMHLSQTKKGKATVFGRKSSLDVSRFSSPIKKDEKLQHDDENLSVNADDPTPCVATNVEPEDDFRENGSTAHTIRKRVMFSSGHDISNPSATGEDDIKNRIQRLVETSAVTELIECFLEMKNQKEE